MQSSTNNNDFLCYGDAEGLNSGSAPPFVPNSRAFGEEHPNQDPSGGHGPPNQTPNTPQQPQINPRDGIINYLVYQGLLTPDLQLTISPTLLNTISFPVHQTQFLTLPMIFQRLETLLWRPQSILATFKNPES